MGAQPHEAKIRDAGGARYFVCKELLDACLVTADESQQRGGARQPSGDREGKR